MSARLMAPVAVIPPTPATVKTVPDDSPSDQTAQVSASQLEPRNAEKDEPTTQAASKPVRTEPVSDSKRAATDIPKNSDAALITPSIDTRQALDAYMSSHHQRALHQDSVDAATAFRQSKRTVVISDPRKGAQQDPQSATPAPLRVNCASELNATLALLSGFAGGTLRCSELGDIAPHIEKRIKAHTTK
ncbi:hypothetical protein GCM10007391_09060 [Alteromonas halophila]|uniref:Uncharacterized protein n=2 Tax=Alteromonas halophila TaxID=516698 RepID=A0A918JGB9_9ALTE|nr:hypothetical protein GCM10007391_09060 [Alteromonas halophila]